MVSQDEWLEVAADAPLDMQAMDQLIIDRTKAWIEYDEKHKISSEAYTRAEKLDIAIMAALKAAGKSKYFVDGEGTAQIIQKATVTTPKSLEDKRAFFKFLQSRGENVFLGMASVNSNTLNSWFNQMLQEATSKGVLGFSVPGIDDPTMRETLRFTKDKKVKKDV